MKNWYRGSPAARFAVRTIVVGAITYVVSALAQGAEAGDFLDLTTLAWGVVGAAAKAALGLLTAEEPFVGVNLIGPDHVEVPVPPAIPAPSPGMVGPTRSP